jgi:hypothetical protein
MFTINQIIQMILYNQIKLINDFMNDQLIDWQKI